MIVEKINKEAKKIVFIYTTCPNIEEARSIGLSAIEERLAISVDYWPINSIYPWHNVIQDVEQYMVMLTTQKDLSDRLMKFIGASHSYTTPMIAESDTNMINPNYNFWVDNILSGSDPYMTELEESVKQKYEEEGYHYGSLK